MSGSGLTYHRGDERPSWVESVTVNGTAPDLSTGYTFTVVVKQGTGTATLTKTTGITGSSGGAVTVAWAAGELDITAGRYRAILTARQTSGTLDWTVERSLTILAV